MGPFLIILPLSFKKLELRDYASLEISNLDSVFNNQKYLNDLSGQKNVILYSDFVSDEILNLLKINFSMIYIFKYKSKLSIVHSKMLLELMYLNSLLDGNRAFGIGYQGQINSKEYNLSKSDREIFFNFNLNGHIITNERFFQLGEEKFLFLEYFKMLFNYIRAFLIIS